MILNINQQQQKNNSNNIPQSSQKSMSEQYQQVLPCVMCGQHNQQMLMLVCMDDPCINCAAIHYCSTSNSNNYQCSKCKQITQLDSSSIVVLQKVYAQLKGKKKYDYRKPQNSIPEVDKHPDRPTSATRRLRQQLKNQPIDNMDNRQTKKFQYDVQQHNYNQSFTPISQPSIYPSTPYNNIITRKAQQPFYICQNHPEEELSYFCFSCSIPICPQCVIHGSHREHNVETTRKAIKTIKATLQKCQQGVTQQITSIVGIVDTYKNRIKQMNVQIKKQKDLIRDNFNILRNVLNQKQKQFLRTIDSYYQTNTNIIKSQATSVDRVIEQHANAKKSIQNLLKKDDLTILQEYSKRQKQANSAIENSRNKRYNPDLQGLKQVDYNMFKDQMNQFYGIMKDFTLTVQAKKKIE